MTTADTLRRIADLRRRRDKHDQLAAYFDEAAERFDARAARWGIDRGLPNENEGNR